jgi:TRAP-type C4-dicarboxylate transport system permease small subunit|nr:MAG: C4-dicarboxylate ABC transporter [Pseudomonadota bacterium]
MLREFHRRLGKVEAVVAAVLLIIMVGLIFFGGIARLMARPQNWTIDAATCLFAWSCFLCADLAWRRNSLISIELVTARLTESARRILMLANYAIITAFLIYIIYAGTWLSWISRARSFQGIPGVSYSWVTMSLPVGALLLLLTTIIKVLDDFGGEGRSSAAPDARA